MWCQVTVPFWSWCKSFYEAQRWFSKHVRVNKTEALTNRSGHWPMWKLTGCHTGWMSALGIHTREGTSFAEVLLSDACILIAKSLGSLYLEGPGLRCYILLLIPAFWRAQCGPRALPAPTAEGPVGYSSASRDWTKQLLLFICHLRVRKGASIHSGDFPFKVLSGPKSSFVFLCLRR